MNLLDKYGLVREGGLLTMYLPATSRAFVFRVKARANKGGEVLRRSTKLWAPTNRYIRHIVYIRRW